MYSNYLIICMHVRLHNMLVRLKIHCAAHSSGAVLPGVFAL